MNNDNRKDWDVNKLDNETGSDREQAQESCYYSYGPHKPNLQSDYEHKQIDRLLNSEDPVEITPPIRSFSSGKVNMNAIVSESGDNGSSGGQWNFGQPKPRRNYKGMFASFLAGAVVIGGLMFAADKMNLFTGTSPLFGESQAMAAPESGKLANSSSSLAATSNDLIRPGNISEIAKQASPAVVKIETKVKMKNSSRSSSLFNDPFFRYFFGDQGYGQRDTGEQEKLVPGGMGTGFIFEKSGYILTNEHVIEGADEIYVYVEGYDEPFQAELLGHSYDLDLAALKITGEQDFPVLPLGNPDDLNVGDWVVAIGNPYGFDHTVTVGVLSAKERPISIPDQNGTREYKHLLQTDASINPGNSGGPLLNLRGEVIGINTAVSAQAQGIGFAIPTTTVESVLENLKNNIKIPKEPSPYIGVSLANIDQDWVKDLKLKTTEGALISQIDRRSPAFAAGLRPYDVIIAINGKAVKNSNAVVEEVKKLKVGDQAKLTVIRDGKETEFKVTIGDRNAE